jgi:hypothetical protein
MILITTAGKVGSQAARLLESDTRGVALTPMLFQATEHGTASRVSSKARSGPGG